MTAGGAAVGLVIDRLVGEPVRDPHPVAVLGQVLGALERHLWQDDGGRASPTPPPAWPSGSEPAR